MDVGKHSANHILWWTEVFHYSVTGHLLRGVYLFYSGLDLGVKWIFVPLDDRRILQLLFQV